MPLRDVARAVGRRLGLVSNRRERREAIRAAEFPRAWHRLLHERSAHYRRLPRHLRGEFQRQVQVFLAEKKLTGVESEVTEEFKLLVAASAITLTAGWPEYAWDELTEVLLYPHYFGEDYQFENPSRAGQTHPWGVLIITVPDLQRSFATTDSNHHVGIHEFAHLLDLERVRFDGIPPFLSEEGTRRWLQIVEKEQQRLERGDSELDPYGLSNRQELLAVAVEAFFQIPVAVKESHGELYEFFATYFQQDPAKWEKAIDVDSSTTPRDDGSPTLSTTDRRRP